MLPLKYSGKINGIKFNDLMLAQLWIAISKIANDEEIWDLCTEWELEKSNFLENSPVTIKTSSGAIEVTADVTGVAEFAADGDIKLKIGKKRYVGKINNLINWLIDQKLPHREILTTLSLTYETGHSLGYYTTPISNIEVDYEYIQYWMFAL